MAKTYNRMRIDVNAPVLDKITEVQDDTNSRYLDVYLYQNGLPIDLTGHEVRIFMKKPETGMEVWNDGEITEAANGRCQFLMTTQALAEVGHMETQISIWHNNDSILSTQVFEIVVVKNLRTLGSIESSNEYGALVVLFQNLYEAIDLMTTMVQNIGKPGDIAEALQLSTMWEAWEYMSDYIRGYLTDKIDEAIQNAAVQGVLDIIGNPDDTGGSETAGTLMGKSNKILQKFNAPNMITGYIRKESSNNVTVLELSGKGKLVYASFFTQNISGGNEAQFTVTIDGQSIYNVINKNPGTGTSAGNETYLSALTKDAILGTYFDKYYSQVVLPNMISKLGEPYLPVVGETRTKESSSCTDTAYFTNELKFERNLTIHCRNNNTKGFTCSYGYYLDE